MTVSLNRLRFLIIDDNAHAINLVKAMLRGFGCEQLYDAQTIEAGKQRMRVTPADRMKRILWVIDHARPFVRSASYFGPDRRRRDDPKYTGPERRADRQRKT